MNKPPYGAELEERADMSPFAYMPLSSAI